MTSASEHVLWETIVELIQLLIGPATVLTLALISLIISRRYLMKAVTLAARHTKSKWDDALLEVGLFKTLSWLPPLVVIHLGSEILTRAASPELSITLFRVLHCAFVILAIRVVMRFCDGLVKIYGHLERSKERPIKGYIQLLKIFAYLTGSVLIIARLTGQSPFYFLSGLGALTAVVMLIFKDTLLSLVASVQITTQRLIAVGDWIEVPAFGADGDVIDVALHTITVQNWDKTLSIIPTCELIQKGFKNWRGMKDSGGRRIKRSINIDIHSVRFLSDEELDTLGELRLMRDYLEAKKLDIAQWKREKGLPESDQLNSRRLSNLGCFRAYLKNYLSQHPQIQSDGSLTFLIRQLQPTETGIPIEIYVFCKDTRWVQYEEVQADIFDHLLSIMERFELKAYQDVSGRDVQQAIVGMKKSSIVE